MSTTIRIMKRDKERLEVLAKKSGRKKLTEALRFAMDAAEREVENFKGNPAAIEEALKAAAPIARRTSERVDEELAKSIE
jgi:predicted DNA-binding protein